MRYIRDIEGNIIYKSHSNDLGLAIEEGVRNDVSFRRASFAGLHLSDMDFSGGNFEEANFEGSVFFRTSFRKANLKGVNFMAAGFSRCDLLGTNLELVKFDKDTWFENNTYVTFSRELFIKIFVNNQDDAVMPGHIVWILPQDS